MRLQDFEAVVAAAGFDAAAQAHTFVRELIPFQDLKLAVSFYQFDPVDFAAFAADWSISVVGFAGFAFDCSLTSTC